MSVILQKIQLPTSGGYKFTYEDLDNGMKGINTVPKLTKDFENMLHGLSYYVTTELLEINNSLKPYLTEFTIKENNILHCKIHIEVNGVTGEFVPNPITLNVRKDTETVDTVVRRWVEMKDHFEDNILDIICLPNFQTSLFT